jgi:predicted nucleic acid-binding protein
MEAVGFGAAAVPGDPGTIPGNLLHQRAARLEQGLADWRHRFADRIFGLTEEAALAYGEIMGVASRQGLAMSAPDGMIAAIARVNGGRLATRNLADFRTTGLELISPWEF